MKIIQHCTIAISLLSMLLTPQAHAGERSHSASRIVEVSPAQYERLTSNYGTLKEVTLLAQSDSAVDCRKPEFKEHRECREREVQDQVAERVRQEEEESLLQVGSQLNFGGDGRGAALVIFVVIGAVVVIAWLPYFPILLYKLATDREKINVHQLFYYQFQYFFAESRTLEGTGDTIPDSAERSGHFNALHYALFLHEKGGNSLFNHLGLNIELGEYDIKDKLSQSGSTVQYHGNYLMLGPSLIIEPASFLLMTFDLGFGTSKDDKIGLMSSARLSLNFRPWERLMFGFGMAGTYIDTKADRGLVSEGLDMSLAYFARLGFSF